MEGRSVIETVCWLCTYDTGLILLKQIGRRTWREGIESRDAWAGGKRD